MTREQMLERIVREAHTFIPLDLPERETFLKNLESDITEVWNEAIKHSHQCHLNGWGIKKDLVSRCFECGKESESGITWEQALNANALGGSCFECVNKKGATPADSKH